MVILEFGSGPHDRALLILACSFSSLFLCFHLINRYGTSTWKYPMGIFRRWLTRGELFFRKLHFLLTSSRVGCIHQSPTLLNNLVSISWGTLAFKRLDTNLFSISYIKLFFDTLVMTFKSLRRLLYNSSWIILQNGSCVHIGLPILFYEWIYIRINISKQINRTSMKSRWAHGWVPSRTSLALNVNKF